MGDLAEKVTKALGGSDKPAGIGRNPDVSAGFFIYRKKFSGYNKHDIQLSC